MPVLRSTSAFFNIDAAVWKGQLLGVHARCGHLRQIGCGGALAQRVHHAIGDIDADHLPVRADGARRRQGDEAGAAGQVKHTFSGCQRGAVEQCSVHLGQRCRTCSRGTVTAIRCAQATGIPAT